MGSNSSSGGILGQILDSRFLRLGGLRVGETGGFGWSGESDTRGHRLFVSLPRCEGDHPNPHTLSSVSSKTDRVDPFALARKLLIALWRYVEQGVWPEGAEKKDWRLLVDSTARRHAKKPMVV